MTGKTHAAVGLGTVLAVTQPSTVSGLVLAAGTGMLGALISDIDVGTSKSHKDANRITLIAVLLVAAEIALNYFYDFSIWEKIRNNQSMAPVAMGVIILLQSAPLEKSAAPVIYAFDHGYGHFKCSHIHGVREAGPLFCGWIRITSGAGLL